MFTLALQSNASYKKEKKGIFFIYRYLVRCSWHCRYSFYWEKSLNKDPKKL